ncbi:MAG: Ig-like domain-containing protein [Chloroflexota bacterium]
MKSTVLALYVSVFVLLFTGSSTIVANAQSDPERAFIHITAQGNVFENVTLLDHPQLNGDPDAHFFVTHNVTPHGTEAETLNKAIGVYYDNPQWAIFTQDSSNMPLNVGFNVLIPDSSETFMHVVNTDRDEIGVDPIDHATLNNNPDIPLLLTQNWNGSGKTGVYNGSPISAQYENNLWHIHNKRQTPIPNLAGFNVWRPDEEQTAFVHTVASDNYSSGYRVSYLDHPALNNNPNAVIQITERHMAHQVYTSRPVGVRYMPIQGLWAITGQDPLVAPRLGTSFSVVVDFYERQLPSSDGYELQQDTFLEVAAPGVLQNDAGTGLTAVPQSKAPTEHGGLITLEADGSFLYEPARGFVGVDYFAYETLKDGELEGVASVGLLVKPAIPTVNQFMHIITSGNSFGNSAFSHIDHPLLNNNPEAIVHISQHQFLMAEASILNHSPIGVVYMAALQGWVVYNHDNALLPHGTAFNIYVSDPNSEVAFKHITTPENLTDQDVTVLDHPALNNNPDAQLLVSYGGMTESGPYPQGGLLVNYGPSGRWEIATLDNRLLFPDIIFHVTLLDPANENVFYHAATAANLANGNSILDHPSINNNPAAHIWLMANATPAGQSALRNASSSVELTYQEGRWVLTAFPLELARGMVFNMLVGAPKAGQLPTAVNDAYSTEINTPIRVDAPGVLENDGNAELEEVTAIVTSLPKNGTAVLNSDGSFSYEPNRDFLGDDSFSYQVRHSSGLLSEPSAVTITVQRVNNAPTAADDRFTGVQGESLKIVVPGVLDNDQDADEDELTAVLLKGTSQGKVDLQPDGSFIYEPLNEFVGEDSFTYQADDGLESSNEATVTITILPVGSNTPPVADSDSYQTARNTMLVVPLPGVLHNDSDIDGDPLTAELLREPANGLLILLPNGSFLYTPNLGFVGEDIFTYRANDGQDSSEPVSVTIDVFEDEAPRFTLFLPLVTQN